MFSITIDNIFLLWLGFFALVGTIIFLVARENHKDRSGAYARQKHENWIKAEKLKAEHIDTLKITGGARRYDD